MFSGSGPGAQTQDGCSVELYRRLPDAQDLDCVVARLKPGMTLLELGCGTGRQTCRLLAWGCEVTAVDNSAEMLAHLPAQVEAVQADITTLALGRRFDRVLLASGLINHADAAVRAAFLHTAAQHLAPGGELIVQRQDPRWLAEVQTGWVGRVGEVELQAESVRRRSAEIHITLAYRLASDCWRQSFAVVALDDAAMHALLAAAGFVGAPVWLDDARRWGAAPLAAH